MSDNIKSSNSVRLEVGLLAVCRRRAAPAGIDVLLTRRAKGVHLGGAWEIPGGKCDPGESPIDAANRELFEETGLTATGVTPLAAVKHDFPSRTVLLHPFAGWLADESMTIRLNGPDAAEWVDIDAIEAGAWRDRVPRPSVPILEELVRWIRD